MFFLLIVNTFLFGSKCVYLRQYKTKRISTNDGNAVVILQMASANIGNAFAILQTASANVGNAFVILQTASANVGNAFVILQTHFYI